MAFLTQLLELDKRGEDFQTKFVGEITGNKHCWILYKHFWIIVLKPCQSMMCCGFAVWKICISIAYVLVLQWKCLSNTYLSLLDFRRY